MRPAIIGLVALGAACVLAPSAFSQEAERPATAAEIAALIAKAEADPAAVKALSLLTALERAVATGEASDDPFVQSFQRYRAPDASPFVRELGERAARDQFWRRVRGQPVYREAVRMSAQVEMLAFDRQQKTDLDNTAWLKAEIDQRKAWPKISEIGERGGSNIWLIVQHADLSPDVQKQALELMTPLVPSGEVSKSDYAYLFDRVAVHAGRSQRYGTQIDCSGPNGAPAAMHGLEDAARVDALRAGMEISPVKLADYLRMVPYCRMGAP